MAKQNLLVLDKVSHRFRMESGREIQVLENINLSVHEGEILALLGPSGCGKTTTLRIMSGLLVPSEGRVIMKGEVISGINSHLSMVFQEPSLLPWYTVEENVALGMKARGLQRRILEEEVENAIDLVGLGGFEEAYPRELSGGLRQRVGLARALGVRPEVLCLDEPFSALDTLTAEDLRGELIDLWLESDTPVKTVVMVTHDIYEAVLMASRVVVYGASPGHVRTVLTNPLPYPRNEKDAKFREFMNVIHAVITEALIPEEETEKLFAQPSSWYQGFENIPPVDPTEVVGLLEVLVNAGGKMDIFELARETETEFGHCLAITKATELLDLVDTPKQNVMLTALGKKLVADEPDTDKKKIFSEQVHGLRIFKQILQWLQEAPEQEIEKEEILVRLQNHFPNENLERLFDTLVKFGRYAELLSYTAQTELLSLPEPEPPSTETERQSGDGE